MLPGKEQSERGEENLNAIFLSVTQLPLCRDKESNQRAGGCYFKNFFYLTIKKAVLLWKSHASTEATLSQLQLSLRKKNSKGQFVSGIQAWLYKMHAPAPYSLGISASVRAKASTQNGNFNNFSKSILGQTSQFLPIYLWVNWHLNSSLQASDLF